MGAAMAKPRVFVSSTYYDLRHIRSSLETFILLLGYEPILSEKGVISYSPDVALDESCYREAASADIFVLIVGGRYGSESSSGPKFSDKNFFDRYDSVTKTEYENARLAEIPIYILIENSVYVEYRTYVSNKDNTTVNYVSVDSINVFKLIDHILAQTRNNPVFSFSNYADIENWLREQWSGMFKELLKSRSQKAQISELSKKINDLGEINETLKVYLESVLSTVNSKDSERIIENQNKRIEEERIQNKLANNTWVKYVTERITENHEDTIFIIKSIKNAEDVESKIKEFLDKYNKLDLINSVSVCWTSSLAKKDFDLARLDLGLSPVFYVSEEGLEELERRRLRRSRRSLADLGGE